MAPTTTKTTTPKTQTRLAEDSDSSELAQQFKTVKDYASYVVARMQQADPIATMDAPPLEGDADETETEIRPRKEKRVKGRRRAANPVASIEASLRRQSELKSNFRSLARPLKGVLDEMARRTTEDLELHPQTYEQASEHLYVQEGLKQALDERLAVIKRRDESQRAQLTERRNAEEHILRNQYTQSVDDAQDRYTDNVNHRMLQIERQSRIADPPVEYDTEDEDDVLLQPHHTSYRYDRGKAIPPEFDSRSRLALDVEHAHEDVDARHAMRDMLRAQSFQPEDQHTVMDSTARDVATARRQGEERLDVLNRASHHVENEARKRRRKQTPAIPKAPLMLMALADAAASRGQSNDMPPPQTPLYRQLEREESMAARSTVQDGNSSGRKRARSGTGDFETPQTHRPAHEYSQPQNSTPNMEPVIKQEQSATPGTHYPGPRAALLPSAMDVGRSDELQHARPRPAFDTSDQARFERQSSVWSHASTDRRPFTTEGQHGGWSAAPQQSPMSVQPLASPFTHHSSPMYSRPPSDYDSQLHPMNFGRRPILQHPPMPPTAQPINHFANSGAHRNSFSHYQQRPPSSWAGISPSPLVALPHADSHRLPSHPPQLEGPSFPIYHPQQMPSIHTLQAPPATSQYGGPTLAPAAGPFYTPQPAFAQHLCRQQEQQNRRRNTDAIMPRFKEYRRPN